MKSQSIKASLQRLKMVFRGIWEDGAENVIDGAMAELEISKRKFDGRQGKTHHPNLVPKPWGYRICPEHPLRFKRSTVIRGLLCWLDLYCTVLWEQEEELPVKQDITLRLWSDKLDHTYREDWDSERVLDILTSPSGGARVMARWHFDLANLGQSGPKYHLQFGDILRNDDVPSKPDEAQGDQHRRQRQKYPQGIEKTDGTQN